MDHEDGSLMLALSTATSTALGIIAATAFLLSIVWVVREIVTGYLAAVDRFWDAFWREFEK